MSLQDKIAEMRQHPKLDRLDIHTLDLKPFEFAEWQRIKSEEFAYGSISMEDAETIYRALGDVNDDPIAADPPGEDGWAPSADKATRVVVTLAMEEILKARLRRRMAV